MKMSRKVKKKPPATVVLSNGIEALQNTVGN